MLIKLKGLELSRHANVFGDLYKDVCLKQLEVTISIKKKQKKPDALMEVSLTRKSSLEPVCSLFLNTKVL